MTVGPRLLYNVFRFSLAGTLLLGIGIYAFRDLCRDVAFRWRMRNYRSREWRPGRCLKCGYDVRANVDRCSECGEPVPTLRPPPRSLKK